MTADSPMHEAMQCSWTFPPAHAVRRVFYFESTLVAMPLWCAPSSTNAALPKRSLVLSKGCFLQMLVRISRPSPMTLDGAALPSDSSCS